MKRYCSEKTIIVSVGQGDFIFLRIRVTDATERDHNWTGHDFYASDARDEDRRANMLAALCKDTAVGQCILPA
jgi:hypothetical protein